MKLEVSAALVAVSCALSVATASPHEDLAYEIQESHGEKAGGWVVEKLITYKVGDKCWPKLMDKNQMAFGKIGGHVRNIERYARIVTGDDWSRIEGANGDKDAHRKIVEGMIESFKSKFHLTVIVEGDDCANDGNAMWSKMTMDATSALETYPPRAGKAFITVIATTKVKDVTVDIAKDGATI
ncbi:MAG: hypothetical protein ABI867_41310, partial [Kofleriaceae bacterium]